MTKTILLVDDDTELRAEIAELLELHDSFVTSEVGTAREAVELVNKERFDLVILDVGLPDMDGREACKLMRRQGYRGPVLMLTAHASDADTILGLEAGANDYVAKPFRFPVLLARLRTHLRQHEHSEDAAFTIGPYLFRPARRLLTSEDGAKVRLTDKETGIIRYLHRADGRPVPRRELLEEVWGYRSGVTTHTLETHIYRLRQKIEPDSAEPRLIVREGGGYKLNAEPDAPGDDHSRANGRISAPAMSV